MKLPRPLFAFIALLVVFTPLKAFALFDECQDLFPQQQIPITAQAGRDLCFDGFAIYYSPIDKKPIYAVEKLSRSQLLTPHPRRSNQFYEEARLPVSERALLSDYRGSGYDRGHNAPAGDMSNERSMAQSFSLANMMPQARQNNQGIWAKNVEEPTRLYAKRAASDIYVFTGSTGNQGSIGSSHVTVPSHLYKLVYDPHKNVAWAYWVENSNEAQMSPPISYAQLVAKTGIDFQLPIEIGSSPTQRAIVQTQTSRVKNAQPSQVRQENKGIMGGWYPIFFNEYSPEKVNALLANIQAGKVVSIQIQYDRNSELAKKIASQIEAKTTLFVSPTQSSPPDTPDVHYERNRVTVIVHSK
ncbi:DNA/RNA non-specific endonuclease [Polynucleobacter necessarius]|uniref:DNA/RNA non-specific endonuclease n=1 Tax=Polynucleobacter necessarius TaxID=576610 RepID=UPI000E08E88B|nr:DNA/RNA non-specific endonuclease [Polynucleobacter necessarius]